METVSIVAALVVLVLIALGLTVHFMPVIVAIKRGHRNLVPITIVTLLLGWTFVGWVIAFAWSFSDNTGADY